MKNRIMAYLAAMAATVWLFVGCTPDAVAPSKSTPPTLTPAFDAYDYVRAEIESIDENGKITTQRFVLLEDDNPDEARLTNTVIDHKGEPLTFTLESTDASTVSMVVGFDKPLMQGDTAVETVTVRRDEEVVLCAYGKNGAKDTVTLALNIHYSHPNNSFYADHTSQIDTVFYYGDGLALSLYPSVYGTTDMFLLTSSDNPRHAASGTYEQTADTLTLHEDVGLSMTVFRRDETANCWRPDETACARNPMSRMPVLESDLQLVFGYAYEIASGWGEKSDYRVTDGNGQTLVADNDVDGKVVFEPLSPTMLAIKQKKPSADTQTRYLNTKTGECSASYTNVIAASADYTAYVAGGTIVVETLGGTYERRSFGNVESDGSVMNAMIRGEELTVLYMDTDGNRRIDAWNHRTGENIVQSLLIVETTAREDLYGLALNKDGTGFADTPAAVWRGELCDGVELYYCGVDCAAVMVDGVYVELLPSTKYFTELILAGQGDTVEALKRDVLTGNAVQKRLQADVTSGAATVEQHLDGAALVYRYHGGDRYDAVTVLTGANGTPTIYVGDVDAALEHAATNA